MPKQLELTIPEPCHEDWEKMSPTEQGRFCGSCQKQVMDFSNMSDSQLIAFFKRKTSGSVCGRFTTDQLDKGMDIPKKRIPWVKYFFQFTLPVFFGVLKASAQDKVTGKPKPLIETTKQVNPVKTDPDDEVIYTRVGRIRRSITPIEPGETKEIRPVTIKGFITDPDSILIPYATITIKGTSVGTSADNLGAFSLPVAEQKEKIILKVSCIGFESREIDITDADSKQADGSLVIRLQREVIVSEEVVVRATTKYRVGMLISSVYSIDKRTEVIRAPEPLNTPQVRLYPNPLPAGSPINIKCEKMEENYYTFQVFTIAGQQVHNKEIWIDKEARVLNMPMPVVKPGMYMVVITDKKGSKRFSEKIIIQ